MECLPMRGALRVLRVPGDDPYGIEVRVELAGDAVNETDGAPHEEQIVRDVADARAQPEPELPEVRLFTTPFAVRCFAPVAPEQDADQPQKRLKVQVRVEVEAGLLQSAGERLEVARLQRFDRLL